MTATSRLSALLVLTLQFISSLSEGVGQLLPGDFTAPLMYKPGSSQPGTPLHIQFGQGFLDRVQGY